MYSGKARSSFALKQRIVNKNIEKSVGGQTLGICYKVKSDG